MSLINREKLLQLIKNSPQHRDCIYPQDVYDIITNAPTVQREGWVSVPQTVLMTIARLLDNEMNQCVENGANSVSMPDDLVELAVWLSAAPKE